MQDSRLRPATTSPNNTSIALPSCSSCSKPYDMYYHIPRVLPKCGHTFCQKCVKNKLINKKGRFTFTCLLCQSDVIIRKNVQDQLPKNVSIIDIIKDSKYRNINTEQQDSFIKDNSQLVCQQHNKKLQMICITCKNIRICPHCAVFGNHKGHNITNQQCATAQDIKQLKQFISIIQDTVQQYLLPHSSQNLQQKSRQKLTSSLQQYIKQSFKNYYQQLARRQSQLLEQCLNINLDSKASQYLDSILTNYDILKIKVSTIGSQVNNNNSSSSSRAEVQAVIDRAKQLHKEIQTIVQSYDKSVQGFLETAKIKIKQTIFFDIRLLDGRNLKAILKSNNSPQLKKKQPNVKQYSSNQLKQQQHHQQAKKYQINTNINNINTEQSAQLDKNQVKPNKIINATSTPNNSNSNNSNKSSIIVNNSRVKMERPVTTRDKIHQQQKQKFNNNGIKQVKKYQSVIQSDAPQIPAFKNTVSNKLGNSKLVTINSKRGQKTPDKQKQKIQKVRSRDKSPINDINLNQKVQLKFIKPTRQLNYQLRNKFQSIIAQIDRQHPQGTLQLISMQISDQMIPYICQYLLLKKLQFSMLKLVKNNITDQGFRILMSYLVTDTYTKVLNVTSNHLTQKSLTYILALIAHNNILKTVYISNNKINSMQLKRVQKELQYKLVQVVL